jgi:hypothetical protein
MIGALINLIIYVLVFGILYWLLVYVIQTIPIPDPAARIIKLVVMVVAVIVIILLLLQMVGIGGGGGGLNLPKITQ